MFSRLSQALPRFVADANLAGDGLQERLRSSIFALLGVVTAIGLVLVGIAANQGWPGSVSLPIPGLQSGSVDDATVVPVESRPASHQAGGRVSPGPTRSGSGTGRTSDLQVSSQHQVPVTEPVAQGPPPPPSGQGGSSVPGPTAGPAPVASPAEPPASAAPQAPGGAAPAPASPPVTKPAAANSTPGKGKAKGHGKSRSPSVAKSHGPSVEKSPDPGPEKSPGAAAAPPAVPSAPPSPPGAANAPTPEAPGAASDGPGNGHGHAYGQDK
jgi:hypothetical protein